VHNKDNSKTFGNNPFTDGINQVRPAIQEGRMQLDATENLFQPSPQTRSTSQKPVAPKMLP